MSPKPKLVNWHDLDPNWNEVVRISNNWAKSPVPPYVEEVSQTLGQKYSVMITTNMERGNIRDNSSELKKHAATLGEAVAFCMKASFQLGLEFAARDRRSRKTQDFVEQQLKKAAPLIDAAGLPLRAFLAGQLSLSVESKHVKEEAAAEAMRSLSTNLTLLQFLCFEKGIAPRLTPSK